MNAINLYANLGGVSYAMEQAGWNVVAGVEPREKYRAIYEANQDEPFIHRPDMSEIDLSIFKKTDVEWVHGSPPCRGLTTNNRQSNEDHELNADCFYFVDWVNEIKPPVFTFENVPDFKNKIDVMSYVERFDGFDVTWDVHDLAEYGVPQHRNRVLILGSRHGDIGLPDTVDYEVSSLEAIFDLPEPDESELSGHVGTNHSDRKIEQIRRWPIASFRNPSYTKPHPDEPAPVITTSAPLHPVRPRSTTPREMARLQSFDDEFELIGTKSEMEKIGTTMPQQYTEVLADHVRDHLR